MELKSLFPIEISLDHYYYKALIDNMRLLPYNDRALVKKMIGIEIDMNNINWIIRFKTFYNLSLEDTLRYTIPFGSKIERDILGSVYSSGNMSEMLSELMKRKYSSFQLILSAKDTDHFSRLVLIEQILKQVMLAETHKILMGFPFSIGIILAYFILKRNEMKKIMTIINAKYYNIPDDRIMSLL